MFDKYKKEKPVFTGPARGMGGFGFGAGSASAAAPSDPGVAASGGFISDFTESGTHYRAHIFVDRGTTDFVVHSVPGAHNRLSCRRRWWRWIKIWSRWCWRITFYS